MQEVRKQLPWHLRETTGTPVPWENRKWYANAKTGWIQQVEARYDEEGKIQSILGRPPEGLPSHLALSYADLDAIYSKMCEGDSSFIEEFVAFVGHKKLSQEWLETAEYAAVIKAWHSPAHMESLTGAIAQERQKTMQLTKRGPGRPPGSKNALPTG